MTRIKRGWKLTKTSWAVLRAHPSLIKFALYGGIAATFTALIVIGPGLYLIEDDAIAPGAPLVVIGFYLLAIVGFYFNVGLAAAADMIFRGQDATLSDGLAVSRSRFRQICGWAGLSATLGLLLSLLENQAGALGAILGRLLDIGWSLITFLAVPVIAIEGTGPVETLKRSANLFRDRWGQQLTGNLAIGGAVVLLGVLPAVALIVVGILVWTSSAVGAAIVVLGVILLTVSLLIQRALSGIFGVALYRYALEGEVVGGFTADEMEFAVRHRGQGPGPAPTTV